MAANAMNMEVNLIPGNIYTLEQSKLYKNKKLRYKELTTCKKITNNQNTLYLPTNSDILEYYNISHNTPNIQCGIFEDTDEYVDVYIPIELMQQMQTNQMINAPYIDDSSLTQFIMSLESYTNSILAPLYTNLWDVKINPTFKDDRTLSSIITSHQFSLEFHPQNCISSRKMRDIYLSDMYSIIYSNFTKRILPETIYVYRAMREGPMFNVSDAIKRYKNGETETFLQPISTTYSYNFAKNWAGAKCIYIISVEKVNPYFITHDESSIIHPLYNDHNKYQYEVTLLPGVLQIHDIHQIKTLNGDIVVFKAFYRAMQFDEYKSKFIAKYCDGMKGGRYNKKYTRVYKQSRKNKISRKNKSNRIKV